MSRRRARQQRGSGIFGLPSVLALLFAMLAAAGGHVPALDFYGQLQSQATVGMAVVAVIALLGWRWLRFFWAIAACAAMAWIMYPYFSPPPMVRPGNGADVPMRIVWANMQNWSTQSAAIDRLLQVETPDIAILTELSENHRAAVTAAVAYPFRTSFPGGSAFEVMLISRIKPDFVRFDYTYGPATPVMEARFCFPERPQDCFLIIALHAPRPPLPWGAVGFPATRRDNLLGLAAALARRHVDAHEQVLLLGDFNATPYSSAFRTLLAASGLSDTARLPSERPVAAQPTWFSTWPGIGLAIDHALISGGIGVAERRLGPDIGSDHRPLVLHARFAPRP